MVMDREKACKDLINSFIRMVNKYNALEKYPVRYGSRQNFYHSERHMIDTFADNPQMNITDFALMNGVTKGAVSQVVTKLEKKGVIRRFKRSGNEKEVFIELTQTGKEIYEQHQKVNKETISSIQNELGKFSDDKVEFLIYMFRWFESFLENSRDKMEVHAKE